MDVGSQVERRDATTQRRRAPGQQARLLFPFDAPVLIDDESPVGPIELEIEPTNIDGDFAEWLDDDWWSEAIAHWGDDDVTVRIAPTPGALTHPILRHQVDMLRRVVPGWRLVACLYRDDIDPDAGLSAIATSPYHELLFIDETRPGRPRSDRRQPPPALPVLFSRIRTAQAQHRVSTPILVRLPAPISHETPQEVETHTATRPAIRDPQSAIARALDVPLK